jgi:hypothetical protein
MCEQGGATTRREPDAEHLRGCLVEAPFGQEGAARRRLGRLVQMAGVELRRRLVRLDEPGAAALLPAFGSPAVLVPQGDPGLLGEPLDRVDEADPLDLLQERDDVPAFRATEAVEGT